MVEPLIRRRSKAERKAYWEGWRGALSLLNHKLAEGQAAADIAEKAEDLEGADEAKSVEDTPKPAWQAAGLEALRQQVEALESRVAELEMGPA